MYYTYILESLKDKKFYTGYTSDLQKRSKEHSEGRVGSSRPRRPFKLIYYEAYLNKEDAKRREKYLKTGMGKRDLRNRLKGYLKEKR